MLRFELFIFEAAKCFRVLLLVNLLGTKVIQVGLVNVIGDYVVRLVIFRREAKDLDMLVVSYHHSTFVKLKGLAVSLDTPLAEADVLMTYFSPSLEEGSHRPTVNNFDIDGLRRLLLTNSAS